MTNISILGPLTADDPQDYADLVTSCGRFVDTWLAAGGEPTDDVVIGFYGLWAQSLDVTRDANEADEKAAFYAWAYPSYIRFRNEVASSLTEASSEQ